MHTQPLQVTADDVLFVGHVAEARVNEVLALDRVLLLGTRTSTSIGRPHLPGACVLAAVEEHFVDGEVGGAALRCAGGPRGRVLRGHSLGARPPLLHTRSLSTAPCACLSPRCAALQVHVFKFKKRKRYKKYHVSREKLTTLRVLTVAESADEALAQVGTLTRHAARSRRSVLHAAPWGEEKKLAQSVPH